METLATLGRSQPILVAIEDMHWGDEASLDLLLHLARRVETRPIALAFSYRADEVAAPLERLLAQLDRARVVTEIPLARFTSAQLATMVSAIFDGGAPGVACALRNGARRNNRAGQCDRSVRAHVRERE